MFSIDDESEQRGTSLFRNGAVKMEDYTSFLNTEGKVSKVEKLPGGDDMGCIEDLIYFSKKLITCLRVPASYLGLTD